MAEKVKKPEPKELPDVIVNRNEGRRYVKGRFLGKGGFARCYEFTDAETNDIFACKVLSKSLLVKKHEKDKMAQEIEIHRGISHQNIVKFIKHFEDDDNVYILLELCRKRSLMELHKRRRTITEPEARYFMIQIIHATIHLHSHRIIHRDMKLGNLFLNDDMVLKLGDFGLATTLQYDGERKRTLCGTPNYIAPEMLSKKGHSYEVDVWAIGCILFTLLVGKPPFETSSLKDTYSRIQRNEYHIPSRLTPAARFMIQRMLQTDPFSRPTVQELLHFEFIVYGFLPNRLPATCLTMAPKFPTEAVARAAQPAERPPLNDLNQPDQLKTGNALPVISTTPVRQLTSVPENEMVIEKNLQQRFEVSVSVKQEIPNDCYLVQLYKQLVQLLLSKPNTRADRRQDEAEDPASTPIFWVSRWVDYSDKYGLGYQLCDNSVGVLFNDATKLVMYADGIQMQFIERDAAEAYYTKSSLPPELKKKTTLLMYFRNYMNDNLLKAGGNVPLREGDELSRLPYLKTWFRTRSAIVLHLNNGTVQINFFHDHTKLVMCPLMGAITYLSQNHNFRTYKFSLLEKYGASDDLTTRLRYAKGMVERLIGRSSSAPRSTKSTFNQLATGLGVLDNKAKAT